MRQTVLKAKTIKEGNYPLSEVHSQKGERDKELTDWLNDLSRYFSGGVDRFQSLAAAHVNR